MFMHTAFPGFNVITIATKATTNNVEVMISETRFFQSPQTSWTIFRNHQLYAGHHCLNTFPKLGIFVRVVLHNWKMCQLQINEKDVFQRFLLWRDDLHTQWRSHTRVSGCSNSHTLKKLTHKFRSNPRSFLTVGGSEVWISTRSSRWSDPTSEFFKQIRAGPASLEIITRYM